MAGGHAALGAAAGCAIGHHEANKQAAQSQASSNSANTNRSASNGAAPTNQGQPNTTTR
jgi:hypothetical protein